VFPSWARGSVVLSLAAGVVLWQDVDNDGIVKAALLERYFVGYYRFENKIQLWKKE
jgi:hypothetical protein